MWTSKAEPTVLSVVFTAGVLVVAVNGLLKQVGETIFGQTLLTGLLFVVIGLLLVVTDLFCLCSIEK